MLKKKSQELAKTVVKKRMTEITAQHSESEIQVVHAIPGRVRLRITDSKFISALDTLAQLRQQDGVYEVRTNQTTASLVVSFDADTLSLPQMLELLQQSLVPGASKLRRDAKKTEPPQESKSDTLLPQIELRSFIPLIAGMVVTGALGVEGFLAFPVFMVAESVTAQAIEQLESEPLALQPGISEETTEVSYRVAHVIPGRIRFHVPRIALDTEYAHRLKVLTQADARVKDVRVNDAAASIAITYETSEISDLEMQSHLVSLIQKASNVTLETSANVASSGQPSQEEASPWSNLGLPALTTTLALLGGPFGLSIPPVIIGGTIAVAALPIAQRAINSILVEHRLNIDVLDLMAITITTLQGQFLSPSIMIALVEIGEAIREQTARSNDRQTLDLLSSLEQFVWVERNGEQQVSIHEVQPGDTVIVYPGEQIPVDGRILRGKALIDEQKLTGEAMPVMRTKGQTVHASTLVREGQLYILTEHVGADTRAGQIIKVMQDAPVHDTRIENYAAKIADSAVVPTLILSGIVFAATRNLSRAASVLTLDLATGIRVSVPTTVLAALTYAARRGILIRSGRALETLASVDAVVFDKTGTLTQGEAVVVSVETVSELTSPLQVLELAAAAEQRLTHPVAEAVVRYAQERGAKISPRGKWDYHIGLGVRAQIDEHTILVGSDRFLRQEGISLDELHAKHQHLQAGSNSVIYVARNGELQGVIAYRDPLRPESREVITALRSTNGMEIHLLTGDNKRTASAVAHELGIAKTNTHAEAFPETKVAVVRGLHAEGRTVAFVGDGINDSPALAYADVSVSFGDGSDVARETADVVLMENNLRGLPEAIAIARQAMQLIHQNTGIVAIPNLAALAVAATVGITPLAATIVNNGSTIVAGFNGLRPLLTSSEEDLDLLADKLDTSIKDQDDESLHLEEVNNATSQQQPLEISTDSSSSLITELPSNTELGVVSAPAQAHTEPLTASALAHRLNISTGTISRRKSKPDFPEWTRSKDPDGIAWTYSKQSKLFLAG